jgi:hypothetical protein
LVVFSLRCPCCQQVNALLGALVLSASTAICWLCGKDPAGARQALPIAHMCLT